MKRTYLIIYAVAFMLSMPVYAQDNNKNASTMGFPEDISGERGKTPVIKLITPGVFEIGDVRLDKNEGVIEFEAAVNMDKGLLEYILVGKSGKLHESLLRTDVEPFNLQIALLMIGLEGTMNPLIEQGDPGTPSGDPVKIYVKWDNKGKIVDIPIERWVYIEGKEKDKKPIDWVFTGSVIQNGVFMAQVDKSIIALYHDPVAMFDNQTPEGASDEIWFVDEKAVPQAGTKVTVSIKSAAK